MSITNKWAVQQVFTVKLFDLVTGENIGIMEDLKSCTLTNEGTTVYASGGVGNSNIIGFDHSKKARLSVQNAIFDDRALSTQLGADITDGTNDNMVVTDVLTINSDTAATTYTALGNAGSEVKYVYILNDDGTLGAKFEQDAAVAAGKFTYDSGTKAVTFNTSEVADGKKVVAFYNAASGPSTKSLSNYTDKFAKNVKLVADSIVRDTYTGEDYQAQIIFYKGKINNNFEISLSSDGEPAVHNFEIEALKPALNSKLWEMIIFDETEVA